MELGARQGAAVEPGVMLFQLADLQSVWINAEVAEAQAAWIKAGDPAVADVPALPGQSFQGRVDYLYPELTQATRTLKVRMVVKNPDGDCARACSRRCTFTGRRVRRCSPCPLRPSSRRVRAA